MSKEKDTPKEAAAPKTEKQTGVIIEAVQDTQTAAGEFVPKGTRMTVSEELANALLSELNPHYRLIEKQ